MNLQADLAICSAYETARLQNTGYRRVQLHQHNHILTTTSFARLTDFDNLCIQKAGKDAQYGAIKTYDYFLNVHGRNDVSGSGGLIWTERKTK